MVFIDEFNYTVVRKRLIIEDGETVLISLVGVDKVLRGEEETVAMIGRVTTGRVEEVTPVNST